MQSFSARRFEPYELRAESSRSLASGRCREPRPFGSPNRRNWLDSSACGATALRKPVRVPQAIGAAGGIISSRTGLTVSFPRGAVTAPSPLRSRGQSYSRTRGADGTQFLRTSVKPPPVATDFGSAHSSQVFAAPSPTTKNSVAVPVPSAAIETSSRCAMPLFAGARSGSSVHFPCYILASGYKHPTTNR